MKIGYWHRFLLCWRFHFSIEVGAAGGDAEVLECFFFGDGELIATEAIWLLLQCAKLWQSWLAAENFDD